MGPEVSRTHKSSDTPASVSEPFKINGFFCRSGSTSDLLFRKKELLFRKKERRQDKVTFQGEAELVYFSLNGLESEFPALISRGQTASRADREADTVQGPSPPMAGLFVCFACLSEWWSACPPPPSCRPVFRQHS